MIGLLTTLAGLFLLSSAGAPGAPAAAEPVPVLPAYSVRVTAYNAVAEQTDSDPFVTASGAYANPEIVAARSRDLAEELPFGTIVELAGPEDPSHTCGYEKVAGRIGYRVIADSMNARFKKSVDILFDTTATSRTLGVCRGVTLRVVGAVPDPRHLPVSQEELARIVSSAS